MRLLRCRNQVLTRNTCWVDSAERSTSGPWSWDLSQGIFKIFLCLSSRPSFILYFIFLSPSRYEHEHHFLRHNSICLGSFYHYVLPIMLSELYFVYPNDAQYSAYSALFLSFNDSLCALLFICLFVYVTYYKFVVYFSCICLQRIILCSSSS